MCTWTSYLSLTPPLLSKHNLLTSMSYLISVIHSHCLHLSLRLRISRDWAIFIFLIEIYILFVKGEIF
jgi:hypothetical protein